MTLAEIKINIVNDEMNKKSLSTNSKKKIIIHGLHKPSRCRRVITKINLKQSEDQISLPCCEALRGVNQQLVSIRAIRGQKKRGQK